MAGYRTGSRAFCPNQNCALAVGPVSFAWFVQGNALTIQYYTGTVNQYQLSGYDSAGDVLSLTYSASPVVFYGCGSTYFPPVPGACP